MKSKQNLATINQSNDKKKNTKDKSKSRLQEYLDQQNNGGDKGADGYDEEDGDGGDEGMNAPQRAKALKQKGKGKVNSDYEGEEQTRQHMRIASSGRNPTDKEMPSEHNELASIDNRSFDPDHEPRKEGDMKMKHSPSIAEINHEGLSEGASIANDKSYKRGSQSRSPVRIGAHVTDNEDDSNGNYRSLNSDNKGSRSNRKIKPIQYGNNKNVLKVV